MKPRFEPLVRLRITPDEPDNFPAPRSRGPQGRKSRRPHSDTNVAAVRRLIEQTTLTYGEIAARTGVGRASICRWTRDGKWKRPAFAPRATDTVPRARAGQKLKLRLLAEKLLALAERHARELEDAPRIDADKLMQALQVLKMARLEAMGRRRRRKPAGERLTGASWMSRHEAVRMALREMRRGGVDIEKAPKEALDLVIDAKMPAEDSPALRGRKRRA